MNNQGTSSSTKLIISKSPDKKLANKGSCKHFHHNSEMPILRTGKFSLKDLPTEKLNESANFHKETKHKKLNLNQNSFDNKLTNISSYFESKIHSKLKDIENQDSDNLESYLEIFQQIITVDIFGPILEKIRQKIIDYINKNFFNMKENELKKNLDNFQNENLKLKTKIAENERINKLLELKLKKLSNENIYIYQHYLKIEEENRNLQEFKNSVKVIDGCPDFTSLKNEISLKDDLIKSLNKKAKSLKRKQANILKVLKESNINVNEIVFNNRER